MWAASADGGLRVGFSAYAVRLLGDVSHLSWSVTSGDQLETGSRVGYIEGSKATSDLYAPVAGKLLQLNADVPTSPSLINTNLYDSGWLFSVAADEESLLTAEEYLAHLEACWPLAQRMLKGQAGKPQ